MQNLEKLAKCLAHYILGGMDNKTMPGQKNINFLDKNISIKIYSANCEYVPCFNNKAAAHINTLRVTI